jgi:heme/copper-type cytochrome/quinol oxidase subunit 3
VQCDGVTEWWRHRNDRSEQYDPTTTDVAFLVVIGLSLLLLVFGTFFLGFGLGTACTDVPGNGPLDVAPCNRVTHGATLNLILQGCVLVVGWLAGGRRHSRQWVAWCLLAGSIGGFVVSFVIARSY